MGFDFGKFAEYASIIGPAVLAGIPGFPAPLIPKVISTITEVEALHGGGTGAEKKQHAMELVRNGIDVLNSAVKRHDGATPIVPDVPGTLDAVSTGIDAVVKGIKTEQQIVTGKVLVGGSESDTASTPVGNQSATDTSTPTSTGPSASAENTASTL